MVRRTVTGVPFLDHVKAGAAAQSITFYGETLFSQVFTDRDTGL
jgi:hypothetical protein